VSRLASIKRGKQKGKRRDEGGKEKQVVERRRTLSGEELMIPSMDRTNDCKSTRIR